MAKSLERFVCLLEYKVPFGCYQYFSSLKVTGDKSLAPSCTVSLLLGTVNYVNYEPNEISL